MTLNDELLTKYAACKDSTEVVHVQHEYMKQLDEERSQKRKHLFFKHKKSLITQKTKLLQYVEYICFLADEIDLPPSESSEDDEPEAGSEP